MEKQKNPEKKNYNKRQNISPQTTPQNLLDPKKLPNKLEKKTYKKHILRTLNESDTTFIDSEIAKLTFPLESDDFTISILTSLKASIFASQLSITSKIATYTLKISKIQKFSYLNFKENSKKFKKMNSEDFKEKMDYPRLIDETLNSSFPLIKKSIRSIYNVFVSFIESIAGETNIDVLRTKEMFDWKEKISKISYKYNKNFFEIFEDISDIKKLSFEDPLKFNLDDIEVLWDIKEIKNMTLRRVLMKHTRHILVECGMVFDRMIFQFYFMMNRDRSRDGICAFGYKFFMKKLKDYLVEYSLKINFVVLNEILGKIIQSFLTRIGRNSKIKDLVILNFDFFGLLYHRNDNIKESKIVKDPVLSKLGEENPKKNENFLKKIFCFCCIKCKKNGKVASIPEDKEEESSSVLIQLVGKKFNSLAQVDVDPDHIEFMRKREKNSLREMVKKKISRRVFINDDYLAWQRETFVQLYEERGYNFPDEKFDMYTIYCYNLMFSSIFSCYEITLSEFTQSKKTKKNNFFKASAPELSN